MNALLVVAGFFTFASAQYSCAQGFCSQNNGLDRADVLGCLYFCYLDVDLDELLTSAEIETRFHEWCGPDEACKCDRACFVTAHQAILPACGTELNAAFDQMAGRDGDATSVAHEDLDAWMAELVAIQGGPEPIGSLAFQEWFNVGYNARGDPACPNPYP